MQRFLRRVWTQDVAPLLRGPHARQRASAARVGGTIAGAAGLLVDRLLGLRGRPTTRALTVLGATLGAMLPDAWDWKYLNGLNDEGAKAEAAEHARRRAAELPEGEALELFGLSPASTREELQAAWREVVMRWHPDRARSSSARMEHHVTFLVYRTAYERLCAAYDAARLPRRDQ